MSAKQERIPMEKTRHPGIYRREGKTGTTYYVVANVGIGANVKPKQKWHSGFQSLKEAKSAQTEINSRVEKGTYVEPAKISLRDWIDEWLEAVRPRLRPSTFQSYESNLRRHVLSDELLAGMRLQQITPGMLNKLYRGLGEDRVVGGEEREALSPTTVRYVHIILRGAFKEAEAQDRIARNPTDRATPPKPSASVGHEMKFWTAQELSAFLEHLKDDRLFAAWRLLAHTGMRRGELLGLRWSSLDLDGDSPTVQIKQTLIGALEASTPKTSSSVRSISLDPATAKALRSWRVQQAQEKLSLGPGYDDQGLVVCREDGTPSWPRTFSRSFESHAKAAGLPKIRLHDLRHTHVSLLIQAGVSMKVIQERLGHSSIVVTMDTYGHLAPQMAADAADQFAALVDEA